MAEQYMTLAKEAYLNAGNDMAYFPFTDNDLNSYSSTNTDWYDEFYDLGSNVQLNMSASGGTEKMTYYLSGSYFNNEATIKGNQQQRLSLRSNTKFTLSDKFSLNVIMSGTYNENDLFTPGHSYYSTLPIISPYNSDGSFRQFYKIIDGRNPDGSPRWITKKFFNELAEREQNDNGQKTFNFQGNINAQYTLNKHIYIASQLGIDYQGSNENIYSSMKNWSGYNIEGKPEGYARWSSSNFTNWSWINRLNFNKSFGKHTLSGVIGVELISRQNTYVSSYGAGFANDHLREVSYASYTTGSGSNSTTRSASYLGQLSYSMDDRYNLILSARKDGNSNFGSNVMWANFASAGASWNIHKENFFKSNFINVLNLKASYGTNGNSRIGRQEADGVYVVSDSYQYGGALGAGMSNPPNPYLSWETTYMTNVGLRVAALNNRVSLLTEIYRNKTIDLLSKLDVSRTIGARTIYRNVGSIENKGIELTLEGTPIRTKNLDWTTTIVASHNRNKLLELYNGISRNFGVTRWQEGEGIDTYYLVRWAGVDPNDGAPLWYDLNGNITREYSAINRVVDGKKAAPDVFGSIVNTLKYKNFNLRVMANYTIGGYGFSSFGRNVTSDGLNIMNENQSINQLDRWQNPGDLTLSPRPLWGISSQSVMNSTRFLYKKTHIKVRNISLGYTVPQEKAKEWGFSTVNFYLIGDNLLLWTPYDKPNRNSYKNNMSGYPMETSVSLSINVSL